MNAIHVADLMASGSGSETNVYKNFAALKTAWTLDAVNNDDESEYEVDSTVQFARMVAEIGYKYSIVPYTRRDFWEAVVVELGTDIVDGVYLQCYDGGANNDPSEWKNALGINVVPIIWVINDSKPEHGLSALEAESKFSYWKSQDSEALAGGGYWNNYDIENMGLSYIHYGESLSFVFP